MVLVVMRGRMRMLMMMTVITRMRIHDDLDDGDLDCYCCWFC